MIRALHVVTVATADGAYGGPLKVSVNQAKGLRRHDVHTTIVGASVGAPRNAVQYISGQKVQAFTGTQIVRRTFASILSLSLTWWAVRNVRKYDVVHIHAGRDLVGLIVGIIALVARRPVTVQPHGMLTNRTSRAVRLFDRLVTIPIYGRAASILYLTSHEERLLKKLFANRVALAKIYNSVDLMSLAKPTVDGKPLDILFCARLHPRKRPTVMVELAKIIRQGYPQVKISLVGPDAGELAKVQSLINEYHLDATVKYEGPLDYEASVARISVADIVVLPSVNEPFPMTILESMAAAVPVVITDTCGLRQPVGESRAGFVTGPTVAEIAEAVLCLIKSAELRQAMGEAGRQLVASKWSISQLGQDLQAIYAQAADR